MTAVDLSEEEVGLLREALDSHAYWQLSDPMFRNDGFVIPPGSDDDETIAALEATAALEMKLAALDAPAGRRRRRCCPACRAEVEWKT